MPNFTPGPWVVEKDNLHPFFYVSKEKSKTFLATVNNEANARLIAAAPDMYRTLVKILDDTQNGQFADENKLIALLNSIDGKNRDFNYMYPIP